MFQLLGVVTSLDLWVVVLIAIYLLVFVLSCLAFLILVDYRFTWLLGLFYLLWCCFECVGCDFNCCD